MNLDRFGTDPNRNRAGPVWPITGQTGPVTDGSVNPARHWQEFSINVDLRLTLCVLGLDGSVDDGDLLSILSVFIFAPLNFFLAFPLSLSLKQNPLFLTGGMRECDELINPLVIVKLSSGCIVSFDSLSFCWICIHRDFGYVTQIYRWTIYARHDDVHGRWMGSWV